MGGSQSFQRLAGAPSRELFATLDEYFASQRTGAMEMFREFDREHMGAIPLSQVNSLIQRLMPDINRKELTHVNLMLSITNSQQVSFAELLEAVKDCRQASMNIRSKTSLDDLQWGIRRAFRNSRQEAIRAMNDYSFMDHNRSNCISHVEVVRMLRSLKPTISSMDLRMISTCLYLLDVDGKGSISVEEVLSLLAMDDPSDPAHPALSDFAAPPSRFPDYPTPRAGGELYSRSATNPLDSADYGAPPAVVAVPTPQSAKEDLRRAVELHREHENRLKQAMRGAQECMAVDADELRRDLRRVENFSGSLDTLQQKIELAGNAVQEELKAGFDGLQTVLVERAQVLLATAADVTAERLAMVRAQSDRSKATAEQANAVLKIVETAQEEKDPLIVMGLSEKFEAALSALHDSKRLRALDACTNEDHHLAVDFATAKDELRELIEFLHPPQGSLRGSAALSLLRDVFQTIDKEKNGKVSKASLLGAVRADLKMMGSMGSMLKNTNQSPEIFEEVFKRIDIDGTETLSWPEFASYFGKNTVQLPDFGKKPSGKAGKAAMSKEIEALKAELSEKRSLLEDGAHESERLANMLEKAEVFAAQQATRHEEAVAALEEQLATEKAALETEFAAKLKAVESENAAQKADFEAR
eukprot:CAMPEP_0118923924 /NCGR_PEP_ID=MMETSP1169-20130426/2275_1 /TAXON_ID=36882 /ORGANISM="Pyramimonas obovata, Strain CCMP722" /LENGTH=642 /DNA_ID=CAMNT_0006864985 /DNA_START=100 /DNA_END=2024 /DNA_ORIENTATION=+